MADDKAYFVVMVACMDSSLAIQNILKVLVVMVGLSLFLDLMVVQQKIYPPL